VISPLSLRRSDRPELWAFLVNGVDLTAACRVPRLCGTARNGTAVSVSADVRSFCENLSIAPRMAANGPGPDDLYAYDDPGGKERHVPGRELIRNLALSTCWQGRNGT
jgi:hypothetical protein